MCNHPPRSEYLKAHDALFTDDVLAEFNKGIAKVDASRGTEKEQVEAVVAKLPHAEIEKLCTALQGSPFDPKLKDQARRHERTFSQMKTMVKLGQLTLKWRRQAVKLTKVKREGVEAKRAGLKLRVMKADLTTAECWHHITRRTDEIYRATEDLVEEYMPMLKELTGGALSPRAARTEQLALLTHGCAAPVPRRTRRRAVAGRPQSPCANPREGDGRLPRRFRRLGR